jgi:hypothetical protein
MAAPALSFQADPRNLAHELGGLTFSHVITDNPMSMLRAAHWFNGLEGLGLGMPFFLVHDLGLILTHPMGTAIRLQTRERSLRIGAERGHFQMDADFENLLSDYQALLTDLARSELCQKAVTRQLPDDMVAAVIAKVVEPVQSALARKGGGRRLPLTLEAYDGVEPAHNVDATISAEVRSALQILNASRVRIRVSLEQVDLDSLKLMEMFRGEGDLGEPADLLDLYRVLVTPAVHDIVNFSLDLLPSVLETKRSRGVQTFRVDGYASIETKGVLDSVLPSELAFDDDLFDRRYADNELFYYGREKETQQKERLHYLLVDASASMRGLRTVFARGLALAMAKKMALRGEEVWLRFFDSRLYERQEVSASKLKVPYLLCFRSERGRNTTRVFSELERELARVMRENAKDIVVTFITHGRCHIDLRLIEALRTKASLCGIFVMPTQGELKLDYLDRLHQHYVIDQNVLSDKAKRQTEALRILDES